MVKGMSDERKRAGAGRIQRRNRTRHADLSLGLNDAIKRLREDDLRAVLETIGRIQQAASIPLFLEETHAALLSLIPADNFGLGVTRYRTGMRAVTVDFYGLPAFTKAHYDYYSRHAMEHPIARHFVETGDCRAIRVSDLMPTAKWTRTRFWKTCLAWLNYRYELIAVWPLGRNSIFNMTFNRINKDFTVREKYLLNAVRSFVGCHYQGLARTAQLQSALKKSRNAPMPSQPDLSQLTPREREVFYWLGEGKDNGEIAILFGISLRTVQKHMEQILKKLCLENRYAAAALASLVE